MKTTLLTLFAITATVLSLTQSKSFAGSATWEQHPASDDWNTAGNWNPATVPDSADDTATFATSDQTDLFFSARTTVGGIVFQVGASPFVITVGQNISLTLSGAGVSNPSLIMQNLIAAGAPSAGVAGGIINLENNASVDNALFTAGGGQVLNADGGTVNFFGSSSASDASIDTQAGVVAGAFPGVTEFLDTATGGNSNITVQGGAVKNADGGFISFVDSSDAGTATLIANGGTAEGATGGTIQFVGNSSAGAAMISARSGFDEGTPGRIVFLAKSKGRFARIILDGAGVLDISGHGGKTVAIGSIEGEGPTFLGAKNLITGANNIDGTYSGALQDGSNAAGGSLTKIGSGTLILTGKNTYTGGTVVQDGALVLKGRNHSSSGTGPVQVRGGILGGPGEINGAVTIGNNSGPHSALQPALRGHTPVLTQINDSLTFKADGSFIARLRTGHAVGTDRVAAVGVTIEAGARINFDTIGTNQLPAGAVFTLINNTSANPIGGTFVNLLDGSSFTIGNNTFSVNYEGGDGNDLTLTANP